MKVHWLGKNKKTQLSTPLLPHGSDDDPPNSTAPNNTNSNNTSDIQTPRYSALTPQLEVAAAAHAVAVANAAPLRSSPLGDRKRRREILHKLQSHSSIISRLASNGNVSVDSHNSYDRTESEVTDFDFGGESTFGDDINDDANAEKDAPRDKMTAATMAKGAAVILVTTAGIASYLAAFVVSVTITASAAATTMVGVAGGVCLLTVPMVWVSEWRLTHMPAIRKTVNHLRQLAQRFQREIDTLIMQEEDLRTEVEILEQSNARLERVVEDNGGNVNELVEQVQENQIVLRQMKENIRQVVLQDVVKLVLQSDIDRDGVISRKEGNILAKRLSLSLEIYGIVFDEQKFHRAVGLSPSLCSIMTIVKRLLPDEHDRLSSFYSADSDSDNEDNEEEKEDVYDMFYVPIEAQFGRGCADSILLCKEYVAEKGERPKLMSISPSLKKSFKGLRCSDVICHR